MNKLFLRTSFPLVLVSALILSGAEPCLAQETEATGTAEPAWQSLPPTATLVVTPTDVVAGQTVDVSWTTGHAHSVLLNGQDVARTGEYQFTPTQSGSFSLQAEGRAGTATAYAQLFVRPVPVPAPSAPSKPIPQSASPTAPHINYTDLNVGSGSGGDTGNGVYVRIFGSHFGASQGSSTLTLGGKLVTNCALCSWKDTQIIAQLGPAAVTGNIVVNVSGKASNGAPFTVTPTTIVYVSTRGSDGNNGSFASPFKTLRAAFNAVTDNDNSSPSQNAVIYLEPGVAATTDDGRGYRAALSTDLGGSSPTKQLAIVGFPGGTATVGSTQVDNGIHGWAEYLTIANLTVVGASSAIDAEAGNVRIINNSLSCPSPPSGLGGTACVLGETGNPGDTWVFDGNNVHDTGGNVDKTYHAIYFSSGVNHAEVGWNTVGQNFKGYCRSIMFHATTGSNLHDLHVHDNVISGGYCDAIGFASVDPSQGVVEAYNNVISHVAVASNPYGVANEAAIAVNSDPAGGTSGTVQVYNNTVVDAGAYTQGNQNGCFGVVFPGAGLSLTNNICSQLSNAEPYIESGSQHVSGSHNLWLGAGAPPSWDNAPVTLPPNFVSASNFALQPSSPARGAGTTVKSSVLDITGTGRANPPSIGAYE